MSTVATPYRIAAERDRKQEEYEGNVANMEAELEMAAATSDMHVERNDEEVGAGAEERVPMKTTLEMDRSAVRHKKQELQRE